MEALGGQAVVEVGYWNWSYGPSRGFMPYRTGQVLLWEQWVPLFPPPLPRFLYRGTDKVCEQLSCFPHGNGRAAAAQGYHETRCTRVMLSLSYLIAQAAFGGKKFIQVTDNAIAFLPRISFCRE